MEDAINDPAVAGTPPYSPSTTLIEVHVPNASLGYVARAAKISDLALAGPAGPSGPTGPQGIQGIAGLAGAIGASGSVGPAGATGSIGPQGLQGVPGVAGANGAVGPAGATGPAGSSGAIGLTGPQGIQGIPGLPGAAGQQGIQGIPGSSASTMIQPLMISWDSNTPVVAGTFITLLASPWTSATITSATFSSPSGAFTAEVFNGGSPVTGLTASPSQTTVTSTATAGNVVLKGSSITVLISNVTGSVTGAAIQINLLTSLN